MLILAALLWSDQHSKPAISELRDLARQSRSLSAEEITRAIVGRQIIIPADTAIPNPIYQSEAFFENGKYVIATDFGNIVGRYTISDGVICVSHPVQRCRLVIYNSTGTSVFKFDDGKETAFRVGIHLRSRATERARGSIRADDHP